MRRSIKWPVALATLFVVLLGWYLLYTQRIVDALRADAQALTEIFAQVQAGLASPDPQAAEDALFRLQGIILETGVPIVVTIPRQGPPRDGRPISGMAIDSVESVANLPFEVDLSTEEGQERVLRYVRQLDARNPPVGDPFLQHLHFGDTPEIRQLRWIPWLQVAGLLLTVALGFAMIRYQRRVESERTWTAMARELAHQLGTPISSLQGWLELLRLRPEERPAELGEHEIADSIEEDLYRLERVSRRFELVGREPDLEPIDLRKVVRDLERYLQARIPRLGPGVRLEVELGDDVPEVRGNDVLLAWAMENIVKNALDALAGRGGTISLRARAGEPGWALLRIEDDGPGVDPEIRDRIFEPGVTTKSGGWGVGLALSRRIIEGAHGGRIELLDGPGGGATFQIRLPAA